MNNNLLKEFLLKHPQHKEAVTAFKQRVKRDFPLMFYQQDLIDKLNEATMKIVKKSDSSNIITSQMFGFMYPAFSQELLVRVESNASGFTEQCNSCKYKKLQSHQGHCYMFKETPKEKCLKLTLV